MSDSRKDQAVIITGAGQGIGKAMAKTFLENGYKVLIADIDRDAGEECQQELKALGSIQFEACDVSQEPDVERLKQAASLFSQGINCLINNAGFMIEKPLAQLSIEEWNSVIGTNLTGTFLCAKALAPMLKQSHGSIINIASTRAYMSEPNTESYAASKGGILALTHALAMSLGPDIRVNSISPGWIEVSEWKKQSLRQSAKLSKEDHEQHPAGRVGTPNDVAQLALYLASNESSFVTGSDFIVDGGMTRKMIYI